MPQSIDNQWRQCPYCHTKHDRYIDCPNPECTKPKELYCIKSKTHKKDIFDNVIWPNK